MNEKNNLLSVCILLIVLGCATIMRLPFVLSPYYYSSDTAVLDLMALHFAHGEFSFYYWGEKYYGVLDPVILMWLFKWFGAHPSVSQSLSLIMSLIFLSLYYWYLQKREGTSIALLATGLLAIPSRFFLHNLFNTYNYIFGLVLGFTHLLLFASVLRNKRSIFSALLLGFLAGFSWYYFRFILFFWLAGAVAWWVENRKQDKSESSKGDSIANNPRDLWRRFILLRNVSVPDKVRKGLIIVNFLNVFNTFVAAILWCTGDLAFFVGLIPVKLFFWPTLKISIKLFLLVFLVANWRVIASQSRELWNQKRCRLCLVGFLLGYFPAVLGMLCGITPSSPGKIVHLSVVINNFKLFCIEIFPFMADSPNPAWNVLILPVMISGAGFLIWRMVGAIKRGLRNNTTIVSEIYWLAGINFVLTIFAIRLGSVNAARYFLPLYVCITFGVAALVCSLPKVGRLVGVIVVGCVVLSWARFDIKTIKAGIRPDPYEEVIRALGEKKIEGGYADYWIAYRMTAIAREKVIIAPIGPNDRYPPYQRFVAALPRIALLGEPPAPNDQPIEIKGLRFKVIERIAPAGISTQILEKVP